MMKAGMRDVDDVEHAERDRHADRHGGIEAAEQQAGHQGVAQQVERQIHWFTCDVSAVNLTKAVAFGYPVNAVDFGAAYLRRTANRDRRRTPARDTRSCFVWQVVPASVAPRGGLQGRNARWPGGSAPPNGRGWAEPHRPWPPAG